MPTLRRLHQTGFPILARQPVRLHGRPANTQGSMKQLPAMPAAVRHLSRPHGALHHALSNGHAGHQAGDADGALVSHANGHGGSPGAGAERDAEEGPADAAAALAAFRAAAERRARQYGVFNAGFQRYLAGRDEGAFRCGSGAAMPH